MVGGRVLYLFHICGLGITIPCFKWKPQKKIDDWVVVLVCSTTQHEALFLIIALHEDIQKHIFGAINEPLWLCEDSWKPRLFPAKTMTWLQNRIMELQKKMLRHLLKRRSAITLTLHLLSVLQLPTFFLFSSWLILSLFNAYELYVTLLLALILSWFQSAKKKKEPTYFYICFLSGFCAKNI